MKYVLTVLFWNKNDSKVVFDARRPPEEILQNSGAYSYVHNFKVCYKASKIQAKGSKIDTSICSESPQIPSQEEVELQFNQQMIMPSNNAKLRTPYGLVTSFRIINVEYKESLGKKQDASINH